jgi:hypothetical protein
VRLSTQVKIVALLKFVAKASQNNIIQRATIRFTHL